MEWQYKVSGPLSQEGQQINVKMIWREFRGWTLESVAAMCANFQAESGLNPWRYEKDDPTTNPDSNKSGFGLAQWTPRNKLIRWAESYDPPLDWKNGSVQCRRIKYEMREGLQWGKTSAYPISFEEFSKSRKPPGYLAYAFMYNYERPADKNQPWRIDYANKWFNYLGGIRAPGKMPLWFMVDRYIL